MFKKLVAAITSILHNHFYISSRPTRTLITLLILLAVFSWACHKISASDDTAETAPDTPVDIDVAANDNESEEAEFSLVITREPTNGTARVITSTSGIRPYQTIEYTPNPGFVGEDTLVYRICAHPNGTGDCHEATVTITVSAPTSQDEAPPPTEEATATPTDTPTPTATATATFTPVPRPTDTPEPVITCGDGVCDANADENPVTCPADCGLCGNGVCDSGEHVYNCPADCGQPPGPGGAPCVCGDGFCNSDPMCGEDPMCVADCN